MIPKTSSEIVARVLETRTDTPELLAALNFLSSFYGPNTGASRRNLAADIESRGLQTNQSFLVAFEEVHEALTQVEKDVKKLAECSGNVTSRLHKTRSATSDLLATTEKLRLEHKRTQTQAQLVSAFLERFQPTQEQIYALTQGSIDQAFFDALKRVHEIHADCKILLRTYYQKAGLEIMDSMADFQDQAYQRVYRWVQSECRDQLEADVVDVSPLLREGITALRYNPHLFRSCFDEISNTRRAALIKRFITALTRGGPNGVLPRPIELHAHDPLRYAGDMLAWLHQAVASERELITILVTPMTTPLDHGKPMDNVTRLLFHEDPEQTRADINSVMDHIFEGVCRTFKARADQIIQALTSATLSWKLANLFDFYQQTISSLLGNEAALSKTLLQCKESTVKTFFTTLKQQSEKLLRYPPAVTPDLGPPLQVTEATKSLVEIATSFKSSLVPEENRESAFAPVVTAILDPLLEMCDKISNGLDPSDTAVFMVNVLNSVRGTLVDFVFCESRLKALNTQVQENMKQLVQEQTYQILHRCGLMDKLQALQSSSDKPLSTVIGMDAQSLTDSLRAFYASLFALGSLVIPQCDRIVDQKLRNTARQGVAQSVAATHSALYSAIMDPKNGYQDPASILLHTPDQVRTLLNVEGVG
mmetsp:Transcript_32539/g.52727  ORF Transcript_32539/g.52727 Transcript_32539/m.52727 type:complete len:649 (-) Transcript_32539:193-2139(-)